MRKFVFNLEPLYGHRQRLEELKQKEFAEVNLSLQAEEKKLFELIATYKSAASDLDKRKEQGATVLEIETHHAYLEGMKHRIKTHELAVSNMRALLEKKRAALIDASRDRKVIEIMKEKSLSAHQKRADKLEQKEADDLTSARGRRRGNEN
jgi:flagellar protein FliJ